jgi:tetratricopeptide (TPR) repeat protein
MLGLARIGAAIALTAAAGAAFPAPPETRAQALSALEADDTVRRAEAVVWIAEHGRMEDAQRLSARLRDESPLVRGTAEQALWRLWSRSGDEATDRLLAQGVEQMQAGQYDVAVALFTEVIRRKPEFAEGWNKRATAYFLAGDLEASRADCDEVLRRNPQHFGALSGYGLIYFRQGDYERAIVWWERALEVNPNMEGVAENLAHARALLRERRARTI